MQKDLGIPLTQMIKQQEFEWMVCLVGLFATRHGVCQETPTLNLFTCLSGHSEERSTE